MTESEKLAKILLPIAARKDGREYLRRVHQSPTHIEASDSFVCVRIESEGEESDEKFPSAALEKLISQADKNVKASILLDIRLLEKVVTAMRKYARHSGMALPYARLTICGEDQPVLIRFDPDFSWGEKRKNKIHAAIMPVKE